MPQFLKDVFWFFINVSDSIVGAALGALYRPLQHLLLTGALYTVMNLTLPFKIFQFMHELSGFDLYHRRPGSYVFATIATLIVAPIALGVTTALAAAAVIGSLVVSPIIGFFVGLVNGLRGVFQSTWLSKGLWDMTRDIVKGLMPDRYNPVTQSVIHHHPVFVHPQPIQEHPHHHVVDVVEDNHALFVHAEHHHNAFQHQPVPVAQDEFPDMNEALRISFEYQRDHQSIGSYARRAVNLYRQPNSEARQARSLESQVDNLTHNPQATLKYLTEDEIRDLKKIADPQIQNALKEYLDIATRACIYSTYDMPQIDNLLTLEVVLPVPNVSKGLPTTTILNVLDADYLKNHFAAAAGLREVPKITNIPTHNYDGIALTADRSAIRGTNSKGAQIAIYRGIDAESYAKLSQNIHLLQGALQNHNQPGQPQPPNEPMNPYVMTGHASRSNLSSTALLNPVIRVESPLSTAVTATETAANNNVVAQNTQSQASVTHQPANDVLAQAGTVIQEPEENKNEMLSEASGVTSIIQPSPQLPALTAMERQRRNAAEAYEKRMQREKEKMKNAETIAVSSALPANR